MPRKSQKADLIDQLVESALFEALFDDSSEDEEGKNLDENIENILLVQSMRYSVNFQPGTVKKSSCWRDEILPQMDDERFKQMVRVSREQFDFILNEIKSDKVFTARQHPIAVQLFIVLYRLGSSGEGASVAKIANHFGIADGGTLNIITKRVFKVLLNKEAVYISWPDEVERETLVQESIDELPYCIGYLDGTEIHFAEKPSIDPDSYYSRKQRFGMKAQIICDRRLKIRHFVVGYPASVHDARMYSNCQVNLQPQKFFSQNQWLAADSAYKLTATVITPFKRKEQQPRKEKKFNQKFSSYRVRVEHCIGVLKERFNSLKELKMAITDQESSEYACQWVTACVILHNMIRTFDGDNNELNEYYEYVDSNITLDSEVDNTVESSQDREGVVKRNALMNFIL